MIVLAREAASFSTALVARGVLVSFAAIGVISGPVATLPVATNAAAGLLALFGGLEVAIALRTRRSTRGWMIPMASGAATIGLAALSLAMNGASVPVMLRLAFIWLVLFASFTGGLALALWPNGGARRTLLAWTGISVVSAIMAVINPGAGSAALVDGTAAYAVASGAFLVAAGLWIRRVAVPHLAPPVQARWVPASCRLKCLIGFLLAGASVASAQSGDSAAVSRPQADSGCSYLHCALSIEPKLIGLDVVNGATGARVAHLGFFWPGDLGATFAANDSASVFAARAVRVRRTAAAFTDVGALLLGYAVLRQSGGGSRGRGRTVGAIGAGVFAIGVPLQFSADGLLSRALWWHNARYAR